jgi:hypothetical protein
VVVVKRVRDLVRGVILADFNRQRDDRLGHQCNDVQNTPGPRVALEPL